jgi:hypothetical protein
MSNEYAKPQWWRLYAILPLSLLLLLIESQLSLPPAGHQLAQTGIAIVMVGMMAWWVLSNAYALVSEEEGKLPLKIITLPANAELRQKLQREPINLRYLMTEPGVGSRLRAGADDSDGE